MRILVTLFTIFSIALFGSSSASEADKFVGVWQFYSIEVRDESGTWVAANDPRVGRNPVGFISYDALGNMSVQLMRSERIEFSAAAAQASDAEGGSAFRTYVAYFGTYEVNEGEGTVIHHMIGSIVPSQSGTDAIRTYSFEGNILTLMPDENRRLRWRKP